MAGKETGESYRTGLYRLTPTGLPQGFRPIRVTIPLARAGRFAWSNRLGLRKLRPGRPLTLSTRRRPADARNHSVTACLRGCGMSIATARRSAPMETAKPRKHGRQSDPNRAFYEERSALRPAAVARRFSSGIEPASRQPLCQRHAPSYRRDARTAGRCGFPSLRDGSPPPALLTGLASARSSAWSPADAGRRSALRIRSTRRAARQTPQAAFRDAAAALPRILIAHTGDRLHGASKTNS